MTSFQGSSEFSGECSNSRASMEPRPSVGRFPSALAPSPLSVLGPASRNAAQPQSPGHGMGGNLHALPDSAQLQQAQQLHREQSNLRHYQGNASPRQLFNPVPANDGSKK